jgi:hypothetical protein
MGWILDLSSVVVVMVSDGDGDGDEDGECLKDIWRRVFMECHSSADARQYLG